MAQTHNLLEMLRTFCLQQGLTRRYWIAYSGGLDSHVLLFLCAQLRDSLAVQFTAIHVNHGVNPHADAWMKHCESLCQQYDIPFIAETLHLTLQPGESFEEVARAHRYLAFESHLQVGDMLLTAHHQDDQAETVLLQLCRGAGPKGLAAMPLIKPFAKGYHARPLLSFPRQVLEAFAVQQSLQWIDDTSNEDIHFARNFFRHRIVTSLKSRWPSVTEAIARSAAYCAESHALLEAFATEMYETMKGTRPDTLSVSRLLTLDAAKQRLMLRMWVSERGFLLPDARKIETIQRDVLTAKWDRTPQVTWRGADLRRYRDDLYLFAPLPSHDPTYCVEWDLKAPLQLPVGTLHVDEKLQHLEKVTVRFRRGGETMEIPGRGRHTLKKLFQEWDVLPWERDRIPLIFVGDELVGVVGSNVGVWFGI